QGPDVGAARAADDHVDVEEVAVLADGGDGELVDGDRAGGELRGGAGPGELVGALAVHLDRAHAGRDLPDVAGELGDLGVEGAGDDVGRGAAAGRLPLGVVGAGRLAQADRGDVGLLGQCQVAEQPGRLLPADAAHAR